MRTRALGFFAAVVIVVAAPAVGSEGVSPTSVALVVSGIYEREPLRDAASGDVNADGGASAADLPAVISGMRDPSWPGPYRVGRG